MVCLLDVSIEITANLTDECEQLACSVEYTRELIARMLERHEALPRVETPPAHACIRMYVCAYVCVRMRMHAAPRPASSTGP